MCIEISSRCLLNIRDMMIIFAQWMHSSLEGTQRAVAG